MVCIADAVLPVGEFFGDMIEVILEELGEVCWNEGLLGGSLLMWQGSGP